MSAHTLQTAATIDRMIESADRLEIADWSTSPSDLWSGRTVLTVSLQGCPWRCTNCEQPELADTVVGGAVPWRDVRDVIHASGAGLDGVLLTGGEPTRQDGLIDAIEQIRELGLPVAVHTNGAYPRRLAEILPLVDRVVLDVRAPATRYRAATGAGSSAHKVFASLRSVLESGVELQVRSTIDPDVVSPVELERLVADLVAQGVGDHVVIERRGTERPAVPVRRVPVGSGRVPSRG